MPPAVAAQGLSTVPGKSIIVSDNPGHATARSPAEIEIEGRNAADRPSKMGGDQIKVKFSAPANTTVATVTELPEGRYKVEYMAPIAGNYHLSITMNGEHIAGSPFKLSVTPPKAQAELCTLQGKALTRLTAGEIGSFTVGFVDKMGNQAPPEELDIRVKPLGSADLPRDEEGDLIVPEKVQKTFDAFDADGSGDIDFSELRQALAQMGMDGDRKATAVLLRRYDSDGGGLSIQEFTMLVADIEIAQRTGYLLRGVVPSQEKGYRDVRYEVRVAGEYQMNINFAAASGGGELPGVPYMLTVHHAKASAEATELPPHLAQGLKTAVGETGSFEVQSMDQYRNKSTRGGDRFKAASTGALTVTCKDLGNGKYEFEYHCDEAGVHRLSITIGDSHIQGSPLAVTCKPGPISVNHCELLHSGEAETVLAGTVMTLRIRARDRFGNETANVQSSGVDFSLDLKRVPGEDFDVSPEVEALYGPRGRLDSCEGFWQAGGVYELTYVPASRGTFRAHVVCVRDPEVTGISGEDGEPIREPVSTFLPMPLVVNPLGPDASKTSLVNADQWRNTIIQAGTRLLMLVHVRDRFGNACSWIGLDPEHGGPLDLQASLSMSGVALSASEAKPSMLHHAPRDESVGVYELKNTMSRSGRFAVVLNLGGRPIANSPLIFNVVAAKAIGLKSRLHPSAAIADAEAAERAIFGAVNNNKPQSPDASIATSQVQGQNSPSPSNPSSPSSNTANRRASRAPTPPPNVNRRASPPPDEAQVQATGDENKDNVQQSQIAATPLVGQLFPLQVRARDSFGNPVYEGGERIDVQVIEPPLEAGSEAAHMLAPKLEYQVRDQDTGVYHIDVTCANPGLHTIIVRLAGVEVIGSPMDFEATRPRVNTAIKTAGKSRGETLYAVAAAIANAAVLWAYRHWETAAEERAGQMYILRKAATGLLYADVRNCFLQWIDSAAHRAHMMGMLNRAARAVRSQLALKGYNAWVEFADSRSRNQRLLMRVAGSMINQRLQRGFSTWFAVLYPNKMKDAMGENIESFVDRDESFVSRVEVRSVVPSMNWGDDDDDDD